MIRDTIMVALELVSARREHSHAIFCVAAMFSALRTGRFDLAKAMSHDAIASVNKADCYIQCAVIRSEGRWPERAEEVGAVAISARGGVA